MINYDYIVDRLNYIKFSSCRELVHNPHSILRCYISFLLSTVKMIIKGKFKYGKLKKTLVLAPTLNNHKTVSTICDNLNANDYMLVNDFSKIFPWAIVYIHSLLYIFHFHRYYLKKSKDDRRLVRYFFFDYFMAIGLYSTTIKLLKNNPNLKLIVFANDHIVYNRCLIELAPKYGIKTLYTQHASVTEKFPPLTFSYSFLDGMESFEKYQKIGNINGKIFLTGSPRFDNIEDVNIKTEKEFIGIALNDLDSKEMVYDLCQYILQECNKQVVLRPHPALEKDDWSKFEKLKVIMSYPTQESSFQFISRLTLLIANESGIHLDAALMRTPSLLYNFSENEIMDWYSYIKKGLIKHCRTKQEIKLSLEENLIVDLIKIKYYVASFSTPYEKRVGKLIASFIKSYFSNNQQLFIDSTFTKKEGYYIYKEL